MMGQFARIAVITGANKGIGFGLARHMALGYATSPLNNGPLLIIITARNEHRGQTAIEKLSADEGLSTAGLDISQQKLICFKVKLLDLDSPSSIDSFVRSLVADHGQIDVFVNNAGIELEVFSIETVTATLRTNFYGTVHLFKAMIPHMRPATTSRLLNIASIDGILDEQYSTELKARFRDAADHGQFCDTIDQAVQPVEQLIHEFETIAVSGQSALLHAGWPKTAYAVSKAGLIAATRSVAKWMVGTAGETAIPLVLSCCPGWVRTDLTRWRGDKDIDEGVITPRHLMLDNIDCQNGDFWAEMQVIPW